MLGNLGEGLKKHEVFLALAAGRKWAIRWVVYLHDFYPVRGNGQICDWLRSNSHPC